MITSWSGAAVGVLLLAAMITADDSNTLPTDLHQLAVPTIRPSETEIILDSGQNYTLYCSGTRGTQFKRQELSEEITSNFSTKERIIKDDESGYEVALDLVNVDRYAVGYYACFDGSVNASEVLTNVIEEPQNTPHVSYIYIYVNGTTLHAPMKTFVVTKGNTTFLIECRPTAPDIKVELLDLGDVKYHRYSPKVGFTVFSESLSETRPNLLMCVFERQGEPESIDVIVHKHSRKTPPEPRIVLDSLYFLDGETFSINCTVIKIRNQAVELRWKTPPGSTHKVFSKTNDLSIDEILYNNITVVNASKDDAGSYTCISSNRYSTIDLTVQKVFLDTPKIEMIMKNPNSLIQQNVTKMVRAAVEINDYPPADIVFLKNGERIPGNSNRNITSCQVQKKKETNVEYNGKTKCTIQLRNLTLEDMGNYTVRATNTYLTNSSTYDIRVTAHPMVDFGDETKKTFLLNTQASLFCKAKGYPMPNVVWTFYPDHGEPEIIRNHQNDTSTSLYSKESILTIPVRTAGFISCRASNINESSKEIKKRFIVYEILNGFGIKKDETWFPEKQYVELKCLGSIFDFNNLTWYGPDGSVMENVEYTENTLSYVAKLKMERISISQGGNYTCIGIRQNGSEENDTINIAVEGTQDPAIVDANGEGKDEVEVIPFQPVNFTCAANAVPPPTIEWYKDGTLVENSTDVQILIKNPEHSYRNSTLIIPEIHEEHVGKYECRATSHGKLDSRIYNLFLKENTHTKTYVSIIGAILLLMLGLIAILAWRIRKLKAFKRELAAAGLLNFKEGAAASLNPEIGIDEQAELLPYDEKFEFPAECLKLGKQLGAGAFGVVYKAEARGILDAEKTTTVAVKMVKKTADNMYIKALASELKIMVHLGKHVNIVNLLGACTKNVGKRELIVIVEYCKFGNIHNYMQKHREVFIDQFNDNPDKQMGRVNRGYSSSSGNSGMNSDYFGSNHTQSTDHTLLNTSNTNRSSRKQSDTGYVQPEWRSNYESDYSFDGRSPRPLYTRDLIAWAFQIARGMEYLASRKVLHGDLAARNVLLADDNIVKICDFGLARSIYKNDEYQKQENSPLPVKWLAIECMTDRIFSTQSDVWSFGVVLWELFSLAKTPYPNVSLPGLLQWLREGGRLEKPPYADERIYAVMRNCWEEKPTRRPTFTELQTTLGSFLEDNVRNHYVDLDAAYMDMNTKKAGEEDYLAMVNAPDYNNLVTPSPHHYVNDDHFSYPPTMNQLHEDEGYLPMSPATRQNLFNARVQGTKFDFDARKLTPRVSESSYGESTPMLDLNNLPRSGSESDQEGHSPAFHGNVCPRIDEEADEVFIENSKNTQPNSITNPTYITMSPGSEKKSNNFANNYINVKIPTGLVK